MKRIKRINSHIGLSRYMATLEDTDVRIPRVKEIPSPYAYSSEHVVYLDEQHRCIFVVETDHKQYDAAHARIRIQRCTGVSFECQSSL